MAGGVGRTSCDGMYIQIGGPNNIVDILLH